MRKKLALYNIFSNVVLQIVSIAFFFVTQKVIIDTYGSRTNGLVSSITQFLAYISLLEAGFGPVVKSILYKPISEKDNSTILKILKASEFFFRRISYVFIAYIATLIIVYPLIINTEFEWAHSASLVLIIAISTFFEYYFGMTYKLFLQAKQKTYVVSIIQIVTYTVNIVIFIILSKLNVSIQLLKFISSLTFVLRPIIQNLYIKKKYRIPMDNTSAEYTIQQKWDGLAQHIAAVIHSGTDIALITIMCTLIDVSVYSVYSLIIKGVRQFVQAFSNGIDASFGDMIAKKEQSNLNKRFTSYEIAYFAIVTLLFTCSYMLITQFVVLYTSSVSDANYEQPLFGHLIVISEFIWAIRLPYSSITLAAGHFKETKKGAWVECVTNILFTTILIPFLGIVGAAIGTIIAMTIRTVEFVYHANKYILKRSIWESVKKILLVVAETITIVLLCIFLPYRENTDYLNWGINALMTFLVASVIVLGFNCVFFRKELSEIKSLFKSILHHKTSTK